MSLGYRVRAVLECVAPTHVGTGERLGILKATYDYIPGSVIRGAFGLSLARIICRNPDGPLIDHTRCEFSTDCPYFTLFAEEPNRMSRIFFRFCYPLHDGCGGAFLPAPKTLYACRECGYLYDTFEPEALCDKLEHCSKCRFPLELKSVRFQCDKCKKPLLESPVKVRRVLGVALDRLRRAEAVIQTGEEKPAGTLHSLDVIDRGNKFRLEIMLYDSSEEKLDLVRSVLTKAFPDQGIGRGRTRGLGFVSISNVKCEEITLDATKEQAEQIDTTKFRIRLLSPYLLNDKQAPYIEPETLLQAARSAFKWITKGRLLKVGQLTLESMRTSVEYWSKWSLKKNRRETIYPAISGGSVLRYRYGLRSRDLALALAALELRAAGGWKPCGFGQLIVDESSSLACYSTM